LDVCSIAGIESKLSLENSQAEIRNIVHTTIQQDIMYILSLIVFNLFSELVYNSFVQKILQIYPKKLLLQ